MLTTSELAEYLGVRAQAIYDSRADGRGPSGIRVGREIRLVGEPSTQSELFWQRGCRPT